MRHVQIDRTLWLRGEKDSSLFRPADGKSCCVGLVCVALGVPKEKMAHVGTIDDLVVEFTDVPKEFVIENESHHECNCDNCEEGDTRQYTEKHYLSDMYSINDDLATDDTHKETELVPLFAKVGLEVEFIN